jgi:hypothetical protein
VWIWDKNDSRFAGCAILSGLQNSSFIVWRVRENRVQLALYLGGTRLHWLPFSPVEYFEAGLAFQFLELWPLLFIAEAEQADYAEAIGTVLGQVRYFFPAAEALVPAHVTARFPIPSPVLAPDYRQLFRDTVAALRRVPGLSLRTTNEFAPQVGDEPAPGAPIGILEQVRRELGRSLPAPMHNFYQQLNGAAFSWQLPPQLTGAAPTDLPIEGGVTLWPLERVFGGPVSHMRLHWDDTINNGVLWAAEHQEETPELTGLRPFDGTDAEVFPSIKLPPDLNAEAGLYLLGHPNTSALAPLRLNFADYVVTALAGAGVRGWQRHFLSKPADITVLGDWATAPPLPLGLRKNGIAPAHLLPDA